MVHQSLLWIGEEVWRKIVFQRLFRPSRGPSEIIIRFIASNAVKPGRELFRIAEPVAIFERGYEGLRSQIFSICPIANAAKEIVIDIIDMQAVELREAFLCHCVLPRRNG